MLADLMIKSKTALDPDLIERINSLKTVKRSLVLSLGNVGIENRVINIGAVDPSTYRNFTVRESAELQEQWDRVAGGEVALEKTLARQLQDKGGYLTLGNDEDAPDVHIGAYAPQVPQIDAVVNEKWGEELGIPTDNAMLINTGIHSPRFVMEDLQRIVGDDAAVSILGPDLDPGAQQIAVLTGGSVAEAVGTFRYTVLGGGRIAPEQSWVTANIRTEQVPILGNVTCHKVIFPQLRAALLEIQSTGDLARGDPPGGVRRLLLPALHRQHPAALAALLRHRPRPQRAGQPARHDRRDEPRRRRDLQEVGLRLGWRLGLHRPHALRDERDRRSRVTTSSGGVSANVLPEVRPSLSHRPLAACPIRG